jgi:hypothetical protein
MVKTEAVKTSGFIEIVFELKLLLTFQAAEVALTNH